MSLGNQLPFTVGPTRPSQAQNERLRVEMERRMAEAEEESLVNLGKSLGKSLVNGEKKSNP